MKRAFVIMVAALLVWCGVCAAKPFWYRYWLGIEVEAAAIYGTKNTIQDTETFLTRRMAEEGYSFKGEDFFIEKNEDDTTRVSLTYLDEIAVFGITLLPLEFTIEKTANEVDEML